MRGVIWVAAVVGMQLHQFKHLLQYLSTKATTRWDGDRTCLTSKTFNKDNKPTRVVQETESMSKLMSQLQNIKYNIIAWRIPISTLIIVNRKTMMKTTRRMMIRMMKMTRASKKASKAEKAGKYQFRLQFYLTKRARGKCQQQCRSWRLKGLQIQLWRRIRHHQMLHLIQLWNECKGRKKINLRRGSTITDWTQRRWKLLRQPTNHPLQMMTTTVTQMMKLIPTTLLQRQLQLRRGNHYLEKLTLPKSVKWLLQFRI